MKLFTRPSQRTPQGWLVRLSVRLAQSDLSRLGDEAEAVRRALAERVSKSARPGDDRTVLAQDQYLLVIRTGRRSSDSDDPVPVVRRLLEGLAEPVMSPIGPIFPRLNAAFTHEPCDTLSETARTALVRGLADAKRAGSGVVIEMDVEGGSSRLLTLNTPATAMLDVLKRAIDGENIIMHYQPVVRLDDGRVTGFEALMRVADENGDGLIAPSDFIGIAERSGLIQELGRVALHQAAKQMQVWRATYGSNAPERIAVNVAPQQLANDNFADEAREAFAEVGLGALTLELTESAMIQEMPQASATLAALRAEGAWVALDDFGVEYSNLGYLRDLIVDVVKIDRSFLDGVAQSARATTILTKIVELAHSLDAHVVAEGVADSDQHAALVRLGIDYGQGHHFGLPMDAQGASALIARASKNSAATD